MAKPNVGSSVASGAVSGASMGAVAGPWGMAAGAIIGGVSGYAQGAKREKAYYDTIASLEARPDFRESDAYVNAATMAGASDRRAQEGYTKSQKNYFSDQINRSEGVAIANANSLETGLRGMGRVRGRTTDAVRGMMNDDTNVQRQNRVQQYAQNKNFEDAQTQAFNLDLGKARDLENAKLGVYNAEQSEYNNMMTGIQNGAQGLFDTGGSKWNMSGGSNTGGAVSQPASTNVSRARVDQPYTNQKQVNLTPGGNNTNVYGFGSPDNSSLYIK